MGASTSTTPSHMTHPHSNILSRYGGINICEQEVILAHGREKKKKLSKLATLRKKLTRVRRHCKSVGHSKAVRDLTSNWTIQDLNSLIEEYEATASLKELTLLASLSRPQANNFQRDLSELYDYKYCTDVDLIYQGTCFPVHRAILSIRCAYFRSLLHRHPVYGVQVPVAIRTLGVDASVFGSLLRYLYTGDFSLENARLQDLSILVQLAEEFGTPNALEHDIRTLLETSDYSDAILVFTSDIDQSEYGCLDETHAKSSKELHCHKAILAARSPFFRNLLIRRAKSGDETTHCALQTPTRIVLDESVLPKQYARVLLNAIYYDRVDFSAVLHASSSVCSLSEAQAIVAGKGNVTTTDIAMEIYSIGQFLDFPRLSQGCEDVVIETLTCDGLLSVLRWSSEPHGSKWVHMQAIHYLQEEFLSIAHSPVLFDLSKDHMIAALKSQFLQCGEASVLTAVIRWGETQLIRRLEEREPNLLSHTTHSISRKGIKKRDLNDAELREILSDLLPLVRVDHIIPHNADVYNTAVKRGLIGLPPSVVSDDPVNRLVNRKHAWIRGHNNCSFVQPRYFVPYYEEVKGLLEDHLDQLQAGPQSNWNNLSSPIPDTLYMVETGSTIHPEYCSNPRTPVEIISGTIPVPDAATLNVIKNRQRALEQSQLVQRAYSLPCSDRREIYNQVQLRVVREFGLPDSTVEILRNSLLSSCYHSRPDPYGCCGMDDCYLERSYNNQPLLIDDMPNSHSPKPGLRVNVRKSFSSRRGTSTRNAVLNTTLETENKASGSQDSSTLSQLMPDIAMATASMTIQEATGELELDLGDGSFSTGTMYV